MVDHLLSEDKNAANVVLLGLIYDKTSSFGKGADKGPEAIIECLNSQIELYERHTKWSPAKHLKINPIIHDLGKLEPTEMVKDVSQVISEYIKNKKFVISLGGEHSVSAGIFEAWSKSSLKDEITILQIDAHLDLRDDDSDYNEKPSRFAHSCVMKRGVDFGLKLVSVGIRAYADFELENARKKNVTVFEWPREENRNLIEDILDSITTPFVYISIDVDGIDPAHMPATGTPVQGGLSWKFTFDLLKEIFENKEVVGADIVEVAPVEHEHLTEYGAAQICYFMIASKFKKNTEF